MIAALLRRLGSPETARRLDSLAAGAPPSAPLSLDFELGSGGCDWLDALPADDRFWYEARPACGIFRLGMGQAFRVASAGPQRFAALDNAFAGLAAAWRREGPARAFCGFAFDERERAPLPNALLEIPAVLLATEGGRARAVLTTSAGRRREAPGEWQHLLADPAPGAPAFRVRPVADTWLADRAWTARAHAALRHIAAGRAGKIVLARGLRCIADRRPAPARILAELAKAQADSTVFAHGSGASVFLGASPEQLVRLDGREACADALAGTAWPGSPALAGDKNRHEQAFVTTAILAALAPLCTSAPQAGPLAVRQAGSVAHLHAAISGAVRPGVTVFELLRALHPTPAVGGYPAAAALSWLAAHGERRNGWYSGGFGSLEAGGDGAFAVALRSALIQGNVIDLQAGAGIVAGSEPAQELAETDAKFATLLDALAAQAAEDARQA